MESHASWIKTMASRSCKRALKRLVMDQQELVESPMPNIAAVPLESNMMEWHCNLRHKGNIYHLILYVPKEYPYAAPKAEIVPSGFQMGNIQVSHDQNGTKICLDLFADYERLHPEWKLHSDSGWSPSYTIQGLLLNLLSYFDDNYKVGEPSLIHYLNKCTTFVCPSCGHSPAEPYPPLSEDEKLEDMPMSDQGTLLIHHNDLSSGEKREKHSEHLEERIIDYISRDKFSIASTSSTDNVFGFGLMFPKYYEKCYPTTPCEFMTANSFYGMCKNLGFARSVYREKLSHFLPLYITHDHATKIKHHFERTMAMIAKQLGSKRIFLFASNNSDITINVLVHLLSSMVNDCFHKSYITAEAIFNGYFQVHRLFLWVTDTYPKARREIEKRIQAAIFESRTHNETSGCFDFDNCFALLSVSKIYDWSGITEEYLKEHWRHALQLCLEKDPEISSQDTASDVKENKLRQVLDLDCQRIAFHVAFLQIAKPPGMSEHDILQRYEENLSFPSQSMISELRKTLAKIKTDVKSFHDWFNALGIHTPYVLREHLLNEFTENIVKAGNVH